MLKGTRVDGIYTADPGEGPDSHEVSTTSPYDEVLKRGLKVMDLTATCMCKENNLPIIVFDMDTVGNLKKSDARRRNRYTGAQLNGKWRIKNECYLILNSQFSIKQAPFIH